MDATMYDTTTAGDILAEGGISFSKATRFLPQADGKPLSPSTLWRWARIGVRGVKLEYARVGRRIVTSFAALSRFSAALAATDTTPGCATKPRIVAPADGRTQAQRAKAIAEAEQDLATAGV